jgi:formate dehydrogenase
MADTGSPTSRPLERQIHPGSGRRRAPTTPKGRQVDPDAQDAVRALLGDRSRQRDLLIEHLHLLQDHFGCLHARHLHALAEEMRLPMAVVYEVASFYAHFDIVDGGESPPPELTIRVCDGIACEMAGAQDLLARLPQAVSDQVRVVRGPCMGRCDTAPVAEVGHRGHVDHASVAKLAVAADGGPVDMHVPEAVDFDRYVSHGGYDLLRQCLAGRLAPDAVVQALSDAKLRGLGGAGFPAGKKWGIVRQQPHPRYVAINADEGEPGTFKDRWCLERDPHRFLEGTLLACWAVQADACYIYLRDEYPQVYRLLQEALTRVQRAGLADHVPVHLRRGAGAYICGEESAMLESIEGKRGLPRHKPPFAAEIGLFGQPTLTNNVETVYWVRDIVERGPAWFAAQGRHGRSGFRLFSVSGRVRQPGVKSAPAGITVRELIEEHCGGMAEGHSLKAYLPGGASGGILPATLADLPLDFGALDDYGCFLGSAAIVVLSDRDDVTAAALNLMRFFKDESCGQCTPCRNGTEKAVQLLERRRWDRELLGDLAQVMRDASICGLGQAAPNPVDCVFKYFPEELA